MIYILSGVPQVSPQYAAQMVGTVFGRMFMVSALKAEPFSFWTIAYSGLVPIAKMSKESCDSSSSSDLAIYPADLGPCSFQQIIGFLFI